MSSPSPPSPHPVLLEVESLEERCVFSTAAFVTGLYTNLLHRGPQPADVAVWVGQLNGGSATPLQVATEFVTSQEYRTDFIRSEYQLLLGRSAGPQEVAYWLGQLQAGVTENQLVAAFLTSAEYVQTHGNTAEGWLRGVYHDVLGRAPDDAGLAYWQKALQSGVPAQTAALDIVTSPESAARVVRAAYQSVLGHAPDAQALALWQTALGQGLQPSQLLADLAASPEFLNDTGGLDPVQVHPVPVTVPVNTFVPFNPFHGFVPGAIGYGFGGFGGYTGPTFAGTTGGFSGTGSGTGF
jgi:hypothetical protein